MKHIAQLINKVNYLTQVIAAGYFILELTEYLTNFILQRIGRVSIGFKFL